MLRQIKCDLFSQYKIDFTAGLNVVLGDDEAKNSIGKSSALLVIDFAMGGSSLLLDKAGVIKNLGHHKYEITFEFFGSLFYVNRSTERPDVIEVCNSEHVKLDELTLVEYKQYLKSCYDLDVLESNFRSLVSPFSRIWNKGEDDPGFPLAGASKEKLSSAVARLVDLFERAKDVSAERAVLQSLKEKKILIKKSMTAEIIPKITKTKYRHNQEAIAKNKLSIDKIKEDFSGAITAYEALFDEKLRAIQKSKNDLIQRKNLVSARREKLQQDISGVSHRLTANVELVTEFFPSANFERLQQVEEFHQKIGKLVTKELKDELSKLVVAEAELDSSISALDQQIELALGRKGTPADLFSKVFEIKEVTDKAMEENRFYEKKISVEESEKASKDRLVAIYDQIFLDIEDSINHKLKSFNKVVYGPDRNPSQVRVKSENSYGLICSQDTGTGKSYAGLVGFDLAMLSLTRLPFVIHDSMIYKNIELAATEKIIRILGSVKRKQIFLTFDEAKKFSKKTQSILQDHKVLHLQRDQLLYIKDWRDKALRV